MATFQKDTKTKDPFEEKKGKGSFLIPRKDFFVTPIILDLNILLYLIMVCKGIGITSFKARDLLNWGANHGPSIGNGQWWRLLTSTFIHGGSMHLLCNMLSLFSVGALLEPLLGRFKYVIAYIATGMLASSISMWWHPETISVGASGAIFGLYGVLVTLLLFKTFDKELNKELLSNTLFFLGYNLLQGSMDNCIDNAAHIGGLLTGCIIGWPLGISLKKRNLKENHQ
ncbi:rhomboid family intramembrane serine protease [Candidatus Cardinium hertigii]|uniref:Rhomboid protease GluP n=1 Tax=Candidatus Cardinium hertigii TaxID=247481 RepID=A0A2Z3L9B3_9BACT|nr:rhomboid family intramembrane serine protease [Candidatus Cardinium hertigii]AWN82128.1 Rhomboid protease GluP [Candidatus Cardinium hertigii]